MSRGKILHGKAMSYNNFLDANSALELVKEYEETAVAIIKHNNPCGVALGADAGGSIRQGEGDRSCLRVRRRHCLQPSGGSRGRQGNHLDVCRGRGRARLCSRMRWPN